jgi:hypothetical protein
LEVGAAAFDPLLRSRDHVRPRCEAQQSRGKCPAHGLVLQQRTEDMGEAILSASAAKSDRP